MKKYFAAALAALTLLASCNSNNPSGWKDGREKAVSALIERVTPGYSSSFMLKINII